MVSVALGRLVSVSRAPAAAEDDMVAAEMIESGTGRLLPDRAVDVDALGTRFGPGDVLFGKLRPYLAKVYRARGAGSAIGDLLVLSPNRHTDPDFLAYVLLSRVFLEQVNASTYGAKMPRASWDFIKTIRVIAPPLTKQRAIADFLDRETAKIDALIEKQNKLVALLRERLDRIWAQTYMLLSGPEMAVRHVIESMVDGPFGSSLTSAHYADDGVRVIRLGNIGVNEFRDADRAFVSFEYGRELSAHDARPGDVVMAGLGDERMPLGRAAAVPDHIGRAIVKADCFRLRPNHRVAAGYLAWALSSPPLRSQIADLSRGATRSRLNTGLAKGVRLVVPSRDEQRRVECEWAFEASRHWMLIAKADEFIALAKERRAALITAAVTGQIDVVGEAN